MSKVDWIAVDWGTSHLRVWVFGPQNALLAHHQSQKGMGSLAPEGFEPALSELVNPYLEAGRKTPVICCGMVGARQGWAEAGYAQTPCPPPDASTARVVQTQDPRLDLRILSGVCQNKPADVMRGEETQIAGFLATDPDFYGTLCLPGTHAKWVQISAKEIVSFRTFMSGELFALLSTHSVLRHGMEGEGWSDSEFLQAVDDAISMPQHLGSRLFGLRAEGLLHGLSADAARARLSGYLIGLELAGAKAYWLGQDLALIGAGALCAQYAKALSAQGVNCRICNGDEMTLAGLQAAYATLKKEKT